jgi:glycosyltransferase involved in cell wall biosynthesis
MTLRTAQLVDTLNIGGAQKLLVTYAHAARQRGIAVDAISLGGAATSLAADLRAAGARVFGFPSRSLLDPVRLGRLVRHLRHTDVDVIQTHLTYANILGAVAGRLAGRPVVATLHSISEEAHVYHPVRHALETWALRYAVQRVVAVGPTVAEVARRRLGRRRVDVIPNAVLPPPSLGEQDRAALRRQLVGDASRPLLIAVGRITGAKGYPDLIEAMARLRPRQPAPALVIVGGGDTIGELVAHVSSLGLTGQVWLLGARDDVARLLAAADIFVSSSHWEGLPLALLEAMMAGLPVVATAVGDIPTAVAEGTGVLVPPRQPAALAAALDALLDDPARIGRTGQMAREYAIRTYGVDSWMERLLALYAEVTNTRSETGR